MRRFFATTLLLLAPLVATAGESNGYLVALVDLQCHACSVLYSQNTALLSLANSAELTLTYAPVPPSGDTNKAWGERAYYAARDSLGADWGDKVMASLFQTKEPLNSDAKVKAWLQMNIPGVRWELLFKDVVNSQQTTETLKKALALAVSVKVVDFPSFVLVQNGVPTLIPTPGDLPAKTKALNQWVFNKFLNAPTQEGNKQ